MAQPYLLDTANVRRSQLIGDSLAFVVRELLSDADLASSSILSAETLNGVRCSSREISGAARLRRGGLSNRKHSVVRAPCVQRSWPGAAVSKSHGPAFHCFTQQSNLNETGTSCKPPTLGPPRYAILRP